MGVRDAIAAIYADQTLDDAQRRAAIYRFKAGILLEVIRESDVLRRAYTHKGKVYLINRMWAGPANELMFDIVLDGVVHQVVIVNPPLIPREPTGNERNDMLMAVVEMLEDLPTDETP